MAGWTTPRTWVAGEVETAAIFNAHVRDNLNALNGYAIKTADQSIVSSAVLANDTHLLYTIPAVGTYLVDCWLYGVSAANAAGNLGVGFAFPTGTMHFSTAGLVAGVASGSSGSLEATAILSATTASSFIAIGLTTTVTGVQVHGVLAATATGTLRLMWRQFTSNANASTLKAGSHMTVKQVA